MLSHCNVSEDMVKIPSFDTHATREKPKRRLNDFLDEDYAMLVAGPSRCGKTNTLMYMLREPLVYYDEIYLYTRNPHQDKYVDLKKVMDRISQDVGYDVLNIKDENNIMDKDEYPDGNRKVVIFDDLINASQKTGVTNRREANFSPFRALSRCQLRFPFCC